MTSLSFKTNSERYKQQKIRIKRTSKMKQQINLPMIKNILTLRYDPTKQIQSSKFNTENFTPMYDKLDIDKIESIISKTIQEKITEDRVVVALSGGIDSVLVLALLRKIFPDIKIDAISVKFIDSVDETEIAASLASQFNANHHVITIENFLEELPKAISIIKMPFWDTHWYHLSKSAKQFSNILVSGDGGDELFGGYTFRYEKFLSKIDDTSTIKDKTKKYLECHERDWVPDQTEIFSENSNFSWDEIYTHIKPNFENELEMLDQVFLADINGKLLYNWMPINGSFHNYFGIKSVTPLLSDEMIQYALHMKNALKYDRANNIGKIPLREILSKYINPEHITQSKQGFSVNTVNLWKNYGKVLCNNYLSEARIVKDGWIRQEWISNHLKEIESNLDVRYVNKFLGLLAFEVWYRIFITKEMKSDTKLST